MRGNPSKGGKMSGGNFKKDRAKASRAGKKGGESSGNSNS
jgi:general stress protein YciG